jgi:hypothetical protein
MAVAVSLAGCSGGTRSGNYNRYPWSIGFYEDDWIYYYDEDDDDDEDFVAGLTDEQKKTLKEKWQSLSPGRRRRSATAGTSSATASALACGRRGVVSTTSNASR